MSNGATERIRAEVQNIKGKLDSANINSWEDLEQVLQNALERVELLANPLVSLRVYQVRPIAEESMKGQPWFQRLFAKVWFKLTVYRAFWWDMCTNPNRTSVFKADTKTGRITVEVY